MPPSGALQNHVLCCNCPWYSSLQSRSGPLSLRLWFSHLTSQYFYYDRQPLHLDRGANIFRGRLCSWELRLTIIPIQRELATMWLALANEKSVLFYWPVCFQLAVVLTCIRTCLLSVWIKCMVKPQQVNSLLAIYQPYQFFLTTIKLHLLVIDANHHCYFLF